MNHKETIVIVGERNITEAKYCCNTFYWFIVVIVEFSIAYRHKRITITMEVLVLNKPTIFELHMQLKLLSLQIQLLTYSNSK